MSRTGPAADPAADTAPGQAGQPADRNNSVLSNITDLLAQHVAPNAPRVHLAHIAAQCDLVVEEIICLLVFCSLKLKALQPEGGWSQGCCGGAAPGASPVVRARRKERGRRWPRACS